MHRATAKSPVQADSVKENRHVRFYRAPARSMTDTTCTVEDCAAPKHGLLYCVRHYRRWKKYGDPLGGGPDKGAAAAYFAANVMTVVDECKIWPYSKVSGYGRVTIGGRKYLVHVLACEAWHGPLPDPAWDAAHGPCHQRACFNGAHLSWKSRAANMADRDRDGTGTKGEAHKKAKLREVDIPVIRARRAAGDMLVTIAADFGVSPMAIAEIVHGRNWTHIQ